MPLFKTKPLDPAHEERKKKTSHTRHWYQDRYQRVVVERNWMRVATLAALAAAVISLFMLSQMTPLKSVRPFLIQVEDKTGATEIVNPSEAEEVGAQEALSRYFTIKYVLARESYDVMTNEYTSEVVRLMSSQEVFKPYRMEMNPDNKEGWAFKYGRETKRVVKVRSVSFIKPQIAQVRLAVEVITPREIIKSFKVAIVSFAYTDLNLTTEERYINPLGFQVNSYRLDDEIVN